MQILRGASLVVWIYATALPFGSSRPNLAFLSHSHVDARIQHMGTESMTTPFSSEHCGTATARCMVGSMEGSASASASGKKPDSNPKKSKVNNRSSKRHPPTKFKQEDSTLSETWRLYGITTHPDDDDWIQLQRGQARDDDRTAPVPEALRVALQKRLKVDDTSMKALPVQVIRRSLDARQKLDHPTFQYVVDVILAPNQVRGARLQHRPGRTERTEKPAKNADKEPQIDVSKPNQSVPKKKVLVVGAGPAGLFCALQLALSGTVEPILLDRGQPVERRGRDIGALMHRTQLNGESNFAFGEGGAGTWSDGKLTTRIGRNSANVRWILETLVNYGAPSNILWEGSPHLGTDNLVRLLRNMRHDLQERLGATVHFGTKLSNIIMDPDHPGKIQGIEVEHTDGSESEIWKADAVVLATGHSARDVYETLAANRNGNSLACLEPKGFAVGFRIEHPQKLITKIQYGDEWGATVRTGKRQTDQANAEYFAGKAVSSEHQHSGQLPVPSYRLATDKALDGASTTTRGVYSFCMCPGGQIVPSSTNSSEVCVNGMSFSKRDSQWANSALVVTVQPDDPILESYREKYGVMAGVEFQRDMERRAAQMGGGTNLTVPVQRVTDFIKGKVSDTIPPSSYRLGVQSAPCHEIYPAPITEALRDALVNHFDAQMPGYVHEEGLLHGVETRTSSPLRISRDRETFQAKGISNLFPAGEGAGFAGGIVSAAVDGRMVAEAVLDNFFGNNRPGKLGDASDGKASVGFNY